MVLLYMVTFTINIPPMLAYIPYMDEMGDNLKVGWFRAPPRTLAMVAAKSLTPWVQLSWGTDFDPFFSVLARFGPSANVDIGIHWPQKSQKMNFKLYQSAYSSFSSLFFMIYLIFLLQRFLPVAQKKTSTHCCTLQGVSVKAPYRRPERHYAASRLLLPTNLTGPKGHWGQWGHWNQSEYGNISLGK